LVLKLIEVLRAEGYEASARLDQAGLIQLVPVESINGLIVFAPDQQTLNFVIQWAEELDKPSRFGGTSSIFYYPVKNTKAESLAPLLSIVTSVDSAPVAGAAPSGAVAAAPVVPGAPPTGPAGTGQASPRGTGTEGRIVVDAARNGIIFRGSAEEYSKVRALLESLDQPVREAFIEVTIAEVTLDDTTRLGVEWALRNAGLSESAIVRGGTLGGLGIGTGGISFTLLNDSGQTRAVINALSSNNQVNILSTPRLLAKSGSEARIQVGNEVPIITSQQTTSTTQQGNAAILQSVQYRNTGVILTIKPVVHAGNRVDLDVSQEVSEAATNTTSNISSPTISNRRISTSLSLRDGASVMLGGLMSETRNSGETGVPILKDVPGLGQLFRTNTMSTRKTELLVIITPYIIDGDEDSRAITNSFRSRFPTLPR
jgi:general secretion pathway protein D